MATFEGETAVGHVIQADANAGAVQVMAVRSLMGAAGTEARGQGGRSVWRDGLPREPHQAL